MLGQARVQWDGRVCVLLVTDVTERTVRLRALVSAADSGRAWELRCRVREALLAYLQREHPHCLPRLRTERIISAKETGSVHRHSRYA